MFLPGSAVLANISRLSEVLEKSTANLRALEKSTALFELLKKSVVRPRLSFESDRWTRPRDIPEPPGLLKLRELNACSDVEARGSNREEYPQEMSLTTETLEKRAEMLREKRAIGVASKNSEKGEAKEQDKWLSNAKVYEKLAEEFPLWRNPGKNIPPYVTKACKSGKLTFCGQGRNRLTEPKSLERLIAWKAKQDRVEEARRKSEKKGRGQPKF